MKVKFTAFKPQQSTILFYYIRNFHDTNSHFSQFDKNHGKFSDAINKVAKIYVTDQIKQIFQNHKN